MNVSRYKHIYVCHSQSNKDNKNFFFSLFTARNSSMRQEGKKIYRDYMCMCMCVCACSALSDCVCVCLCLRSHIRHCTADDGIYTTLSKRKEKADTHSLLLFHIASSLSFHIHHHHHSTHTHKHTQLLLTDSYTVHKTSKQVSKQAGKQKQRKASK